MCMANVYGGQHNSSVCGCGSCVALLWPKCSSRVCGSKVCGSLKCGFSVVLEWVALLSVVLVCEAQLWL